MGYIQLIIILLFVGIALINAFSKLSKRQKLKEKDEKVLKNTLYHEVDYPSVEDEASIKEPSNLVPHNDRTETSAIDKASIEKNYHEEKIEHIDDFHNSGEFNASIEPETSRFNSKNFNIVEDMTSPGISSRSKRAGYEKTKRFMERIRKLSFFKQSVVMAEILGKPKGM